MRMLDLFCGAGGAAMGLHRAFPDADIVGVDIRPQPRYPFSFVEADAMTYPLGGFDFIWASPPCQRYMTGGNVRNRPCRPDLLVATRLRLEKNGAPFIIENVPGAPMRASVLLCGSMFGLPLRRHRLFETSWPFPALAPASCHHGQPICGVYGALHGRQGAWPGMLPDTLETRRAALGIDWMIAAELSQAIPPIYSEYLAQFIPLSSESASGAESCAPTGSAPDAGADGDRT